MTEPLKQPLLPSELLQKLKEECQENSDEEAYRRHWSKLMYLEYCIRTRAKAQGFRYEMDIPLGNAASALYSPFISVIFTNPLISVSAPIFSPHA
jgi:hypothetical protein